MQQKVIRDKERAEREARGEQYSFRKFLRWWKETQRKPFVIHDEETFARMLEEDRMKNFVRGPSSARRKLHKKMSYNTRFMLEVGDPLIYHLKRKAHVTKMITVRYFFCLLRPASFIGCRTLSCPFRRLTVCFA